VANTARIEALLVRADAGTGLDTAIGYGPGLRIRPTMPTQDGSACGESPC